MKAVVLYVKIALCITGYWYVSGSVVNDPICGRPAVAPSVTLMARIIGGIVARAHSWPWQCSIRYQYSSPPWRQFCGASVVSDRHIVTAAHCLLVMTHLYRHRNCSHGCRILFKLNKTSNSHFGVEAILVTLTTATGVRCEQTTQAAEIILGKWQMTAS